MKNGEVIKYLEEGSCQYCPYISESPKTCIREDCVYKTAVLTAIENLKKIDQIVKTWEIDTWTDNISYDCMCKIRDVLGK